MGHFSRYIMPGAKRVGVTQTIETEVPPLAPSDIKNGAALLFAPCDPESKVCGPSAPDPRRSRRVVGPRRPTLGALGAPVSYGVCRRQQSPTRSFPMRDPPPAPQVQMFSLDKGGGSGLQGRSLVAAGTNEAPGSDGFNIGGECVEFCLSGK